MSKKLLIPAMCAVAAVVWAEPQRTLIVTENKFPEPGKAEVGYSYFGRESGDDAVHDHALVARYGLIENLTLRVHVPYVSYQPEFATDEDGLGDVRLGLDLVSFQDVFSYPFVIPHLDVSFPTGDEDKNLGAGETVFRAGVAIGTKTHDQFVWVIDASYSSASDAVADKQGDLFDIALGILWELSDRFTVQAEGMVRHYEAYDSAAVLLGGGMSYKWTPSLLTSVYMGQWNSNDSGEDTVFKAAVSYGF